MKNRKQIASERRAAAQAKIAQGDRPKITGSNQKKMLATAAAYTARHGKLCIAGAFNLPAVDAFVRRLVVVIPGSKRLN